MPLATETTWEGLEVLPSPKDMDCRLPALSCVGAQGLLWPQTFRDSEGSCSAGPHFQPLGQESRMAAGALHSIAYCNPAWEHGHGSPTSAQRRPSHMTVSLPRLPAGDGPRSIRHFRDPGCGYRVKVEQPGSQACRLQLKPG